jgi:hypothetical protein
LIAAKNFLTSARPQRQRLGDDDAGERGGWVAAQWSPSLRATRRKPSCLISCSQTDPEGGLSAFVGKHGAMKPVAATCPCHRAAGPR